MLDDHSSLPTPAQVHSWADTLPPFAAEVVSQADVTRPHIYTQLAATPKQVRAARSHITEWVQRIGFPATDGQDVILASDEAVSNVVEHAYPGTTAGTLTLFAACTRAASAVRIIVTDHGLWRPPPADPGFRGRGLAMMERLADLFRLTHGPHGTTVVLGWPLPS